MPIYTIPNMTTGIDSVIVETVQEVPIFMTMFLFFIFGVIFIGGVVNQKKRQGTADFPMWASISSITVTIIALPLTLTAGIIQPFVLGVCIAITIMCAFWLFMNRTRSEI